MPQLQTVAPLESLPENEGYLFRSGPYQIALFRQGEKVFAIHNECPHAGASLFRGYVEDQTVECPLHCWQFDIATGECLTVAGMDVETFEVKVEDGLVKITLPD